MSIIPVTCRIAVDMKVKLKKRGEGLKWSIGWVVHGAGL
jgi:hypothetical protein